MKYNGPKIFVALLGLPRSGTSIITRTLHSLDNGFCISEPLHKIEGWNRFSKPIDKIGMVKGVKARGHIIPALYRHFRKGPWMFGGLKEVDIAMDNGDCLRWDPVLLSAVEPQLVFIHRDPVMIYDAWMRSEFKTRGIDKFLNTLAIFQELRQKHPKAPVIRYEEFCADPVGELNRTFGPGSFSGEVKLKPVHGIMGPMDGRAKGSVEVLKPKRAALLPPDIVERIEKECKQ